MSLRILKSTLLLNKVFLCLSNQKMSLLNVVGLLQHQSRKSNVLCFRAGQKVMRAKIRKLEVSVRAKTEDEELRMIKNDQVDHHEIQENDVRFFKLTPESISMNNCCSWI